MKYSNIQGLKKHLQEGAPDHLAPLYLTIASDPYDRDAAYKALLAVLPSGYEVKRLEGKGVTPSVISTELGSQSLFATLRVVRIKEAHQIPRAALEHLMKVMKDPIAGVVVVLEAESLREGKLTRFSESVGVVYKPASVSVKEARRGLAQWLMHEAAAGGCKIDAKAAEQLASSHGASKQRLSLELDKLISYVACKRGITPADVALLCTEEKEESAWELGRAIMTGDTKGMLALLGSLLRTHHDAHSLIGQIRYQIQTAFQVLSLVESGGTHAVTGQFPYMKGWVLDRNVEMARGYGRERFQRALVAIQAADLKVKSMNVKSELVLEMLVVRLGRGAC